MKSNDIKKINQVLKEVGELPIFRNITADLQYLNRRLVDNLFDSAFEGVTEIIQVFQKTKEGTIEASAEAGIGTPDLLDLIFRLKSSIKSNVRGDERFEAIIKREIQGIWRMAMAEVVLQNQGHITEDLNDPDFLQRPYVRLRDALQPFGPKNDEDLFVELYDLLVDEGDAKTIIDRKREDERGHPGVAQFVYAVKDPFPMASILIAPPNDDLGIDGNSWAWYPPAVGRSRYFFGSPIRPQKGQRVTFLSLYYVIDILPI